MLYGSLGVGSLIAGLAFSRIFSVPRIRLLTPASLLCAGLLIVALCANRSWFVGAAVIGMFSLSITTTIMIGITYRQIAAPDAIRSSVNVIGRMIAWGGQPFGAAIGAVLAATFSVRSAYAVAATVMLVASAGAYAALRVRPSPHTPGSGAATIESL